MSRYGLRDDQWEHIKDLLSGKAGDRVRNRRFVEAVLYRYRAGIPWRDLPEPFGDWKHTHRRFNCWARGGVWQRVFEHRALGRRRRHRVRDDRQHHCPRPPARRRRIKKR